MSSRSAQKEHGLFRCLHASWAKFPRGACGELWLMTIRKLNTGPVRLDRKSSVIPNTDSLLDQSDKPARIGFHVTAGGVTYYLTHLKLNPHKTRAINIRKLRDAQNTDFLKNQIPVGASDGSVQWIRIDNVAVTGRVVVIQKQGGIASAYDCCLCCCPDSFMSLAVTPATCTMIPGQNMDDTATAAYQQPCNGPYDYYNVSDSATWSSSNTSVATMGGTYPYQCNAVGGGTSTIKASFQDYDYAGYCPSCTQKLVTKNGNNGTNVNVPDHLQVVSDINGPLSNCTSIIGRQITFKVVGSNNLVVGVAVPVKENFTSLSQNSCGN